MEKLLHNLYEPDTESLGRALAKRLFPGAFLALFGDLGAGKTTLTRAVAAELGIDDVASPTFTIVREHMGTHGGAPLPLFHFDAYRLGSAEELFAIGFDDYLLRGGAILMEWCENVPEALPPARLEVHIFGSGDEPRTVRLIAYGADYEPFLEWED